MSRFRLLTAAGLWLVPVLVAAGSDLQGTDPRSGKPVQPVPVLPVLPGTEEGATCGNHGTSVQFVGSPREAAAQALKEEKLVFVLHVSGHFEDPQFT